MNKFTNEQLVEIKTLKSIEDFKTFLTKENITLTDEQMAKAVSYFKSGKLELTDDNLEMVAGGENKEQYIEKQARDDGRHISVGNGENIIESAIMNHFCDCFIEQVWARSYEFTDTGMGGHMVRETTYYDCKCYSCGKTMAEHKVTGKHNM